MKLLAILAAVLVAWFLLKMSSDASGAAASTSPDELDYLNEADESAAPPDLSDAGADVQSYSPLANAIANAEGFGKSDAVPTRANNPGDLEVGDVGYGTITAKGGQQITIFGNVGDGWARLNRQIDLIFSGRSRYYKPDETLNDFGSTYSGGSPSYGSNLANFLGVDSNATLSQANGS